MVLPAAADAAAWLVDTARAALAAGAALELDTVLVLRALAPDRALVAQAVERLAAREARHADDDLAARARDIALAVRIALDDGDEELGRQIVGDLESDLLGRYRPGRSLGSVEADVAMASLLLDVWDAGHQLPHQMLAEELMLVALRVYGPRCGGAAFPVRSEAARAFARLHRATGKPEYHRHASALLADFSGTYRDHGLAAARYVLALQALAADP